jgi:hypothetical protein
MAIKTKEKRSKSIISKTQHKYTTICHPERVSGTFFKLTKKDALSMTR